MSRVVARVIGCFKSTNETLKLTKFGNILNEKINSQITNTLKNVEYKAEVGETCVIHQNDGPVIVVTGFGPDNASYCYIDDLEIKHENIRTGIANAAKLCQNNKWSEIIIEDCDEFSKYAAEGAYLSTYHYEEFKNKCKSILKITSSENTKDFEEGKIFAESQNYAKYLTDMPANCKPPQRICSLIDEKFKPFENISIKIRDKKWIVAKKMNSFLSVSQGSVEPPCLLEIKYSHPESKNSKPIVFVGKGITFDSGGISIKPAENMGLMRGDMGGAAAIIGALEGVCKLNWPLNIIVIVPFTENMPSGSATRPGDIYTAMNGKTIEVDNTDAEGRLILADALCYAHEFDPLEIIDLATLTGAIGITLGTAATGIFSHCPPLVEEIKKAGSVSGDRIWQLPLYKIYNKWVEGRTCDLININKRKTAQSSTAAAFLKEFVTIERWAHLDIASVMYNEDDVPYLTKGMSGRPTRTLLEYLKKKAIAKN